jgi:hypothetical protein
MTWPQLIIAVAHPKRALSMGAVSPTRRGTARAGGINLTG